MAELNYRSVGYPEAGWDQRVTGWHALGAGAGAWIGVEAGSLATLAVMHNRGGSGGLHLAQFDAGRKAKFQSLALQKQLTELRAGIDPTKKNTKLHKQIKFTQREIVNAEKTVASALADLRFAPDDPFTKAWLEVGGKDFRYSPWSRPVRTLKAWQKHARAAGKTGFFVRGAAGHLGPGNISSAAMLLSGGLVGAGKMGAMLSPITLPLAYGLPAYNIISQSGMTNQTIGKPLWASAVAEGQNLLGFQVGSVVGSALGSLGGPVGSAIGYVAGAIAGSIVPWETMEEVYRSKTGIGGTTFGKKIDRAVMAAQGYGHRNPFRRDAVGFQGPEGAITMRQMSLTAIHKSPLNDRALLLGREAQRMHM